MKIKNQITDYQQLIKIKIIVNTVKIYIKNEKPRKIRDQQRMLPTAKATARAKAKARAEAKQRTTIGKANRKAKANH